MNIVVFLPLGGSLANLNDRGELLRFEDYYMHAYLKRFEKIAVVSYENERSKMAKIELLINPFKIHRYLWQFILPFFHRRQIASPIYRVMQMDGLIPALLSKILYGGKIVVTYGFDYKKFALHSGKIIQAIIYLLYEILLLPLVDLIIVPNRSIFDRFSYKPSLALKILYLPNGVDSKKFAPLGKKKLDILSIGRLESQKNYRFLIAAISKVAKKLPDLKLTIVGSGSEKDSLIKLAREGDIKLNIIDKVPYENLPDIYNQHTIFVSTSLFEGSPKVVLEAMSCSCTVLASRVEGNREIIDDGVNGLLFDLDENDLARKLTLVLKNKNLRKRLGDEARKTIQRDYEINKLIDSEISSMISLAKSE